MDRKQLLRANKRRRLQLFRDYFFDADNFHFNEHDGKKCLQTQLADVASNNKVEKFSNDDDMFNYQIVAEFFGLAYTTVVDLRYADNWGTRFKNDDSICAEDAKNGLTNIIKNYADYKA